LTDIFGGTYTYNSSNELTSRPPYSWTYDNNGNTTSETVSGSGTTSYTWDFENRLTQAALPGTGGTVTFKYDPFGRRIEKGGPFATTIYAYDGDNRIEDLDSTGTATARYTQGLGIDEPLEVFEGNASYYYHADGLGSVTELTKKNASTVNTYFYDTFGDDSPASSETVANPFHYTARERDSETKLYYYRARYYDPLFGRFLSEDPTRFRGGCNFYPYVSNDPLNLTDPFGLSASCGCNILAHAAAGAAIGAGVGTVVGGVGGAIVGGTTGGAAGTVVEPGGGTAAGVLGGAAGGAVVGSRLGALAGSAIGAAAGALVAVASCQKGPSVTCWNDQEFQDPLVDPLFKLCHYHCSDGTTRSRVGLRRFRCQTFFEE